MEFKDKESLYKHIVSKVNEYAESIGCDKIEKSSDTFGDLGFDSMDTLQVCLVLEKELSFELDVFPDTSIGEYTDMVWNAVNQKKRWQGKRTIR